jgi:hypothetical protein
MESTLLPEHLRNRYSTLAEALLDLEDSEIGALRLKGPFVCSPDTRIIHSTELVRSRPENPRAAVRQRYLFATAPVAGYEDLFPPDGPPGQWHPAERFYRTRYMQRSAVGKPHVTTSLLEKFGLTDVPSYWKAVSRGDIIPFNEISLDAVPPTSDRSWAIPIAYDGVETRTRIAIGYRGCSQVYKYPFQPGAFRRPTGDDQAKRFDQFKRFVGNLVTELVWSVWRIALTVNEKESFLQHYYVLPRSYLVDITYDVNIAKAFACAKQADRSTHTPVLYKVALYNIDYYDWGAANISELPIARPQIQRAISLLGLDPRMGDQAGVIVALTEHPFFFTHEGTSWNLFGGPKFRVGNREFTGPYLNESEYAELNEMLYPGENPDVVALLTTICDKATTALRRFTLFEMDREEITKRFTELKKELQARAEDP